MSAKPILRPLAESPDDSAATLQHVIDAVSGADGYWPRRVETAFAKAGFTVHRIEREEFHPSVWTVWLARGALVLPRENQAASTLLRQALRKSGLRIRAGELTVLEQRREKIKCAFVFGCAGPPPVDLD